MTVESNIGDAYDVLLTDDNQVRLELIVTKAAFPDFSLVMRAQVALGIARKLLACAEYAVHRGTSGNQAAGGAHGG